MHNFPSLPFAYHNPPCTLERIGRVHGRGPFPFPTTQHDPAAQKQKGRIPFTFHWRFTVDAISRDSIR